MKKKLNIKPKVIYGRVEWEDIVIKKLLTDKKVEKWLRDQLRDI